MVVVVIEMVLVESETVNPVVEMVVLVEWVIEEMGVEVETTVIVIVEVLGLDGGMELVRVVVVDF